MRPKHLAFFAAAAFAASVAPAAAYEAYTPSAATLRAGAGVGFPAVTVIPAYAPVNVTSCGFKWCQVSYANIAGFIFKPLLVAGAPAPAVAAAPLGILGDLLEAPAAVVAPLAPAAPAAPVVATY
jgi:hypothetical protein